MSHPEATLRIALAQLELPALDVSGNLSRTTGAIEQAAGAKADLVILPEMSNTGYVLDGSLLGPVAEPVTPRSETVAGWCDAAARHGITVVGGLAERDGDQLYNSAVVIGPDGVVRQTYRKLHLFAGETEVFAPGDRGLEVVEVNGLRIGILICYDLRFPEATRILAVAGADIIAVPTAWVGGFDRTTEPDADIGQVRTVRVMANLNSTPIACAGQVGATGPFSFLGSSLVVDPFGVDVEPPAGRTQSGVRVVDLDRSLLTIARDRGDGMAPLQQRRTDVYDARLGYRGATESPVGKGVS
ncbi:nitrilase-related carbon-nitrogen hydrolase [Nocardia sp. R6R-6]|uniref:nitrilase-related carbon-nitrogen hydrolase n=1 Tax=Nocardia sp. R6R-6 TaxID=3459303 RepID=UPI00403D8B4D